MIFRILKKLVVLCLVLLMLQSRAFATSLEIDEAGAFANFIRELVHTTFTPASKSSSLCIFGNDEVSKSIMTQEKNVIDLNIEPKKYEACKAIYISQSRQKIMKAEIEKFSSKKIMTVAIFEGFTEVGGMVQIQMGRRNFELILDPKQIKISGIKLNALVLSLVIN